MVARETSLEDALRHLGGAMLPDAPAAAAKLEVYARILAEIAIPRGFVGPGEVSRLLPRHVLESAYLLPFVGQRESLIDVGTGAGLPGVPLACLRPGRVVLVESDGKRCAFLEGTVAKLELSADVVRARAEDAARAPALRENFGVAVARALAPPPVALELVLPFVAVGGRAVLSLGPSASGDIEAPTRAAHLLGGGDPTLENFEVPGLEGTRYAMIVEKTSGTPARYPRRVGIPAKRPLGKGSG